MAQMNLKRAVSALLVVVVAAIAASSASAASYKSEVASPGKTFVSGVREGNQVFKAGATVECTGETAEGSFISGSSSLSTEDIDYSGCKVAGQAADVEMNGCNYKFGEPTGTASPFTIKTVTIEGSSCTEIVVTATTAGCTIKIKPQTTTGTTTATNEAGPPKFVKVSANVANITSTSSGGVCGTKGTTSNATYTGKLVVRGFQNAFHTEPTGIFIG